MPNEIPTQVRAKTRARDLGRCIRCGMKGAELHHRRKRRGSDPHRHCPCNLVWLCHTCHQGRTGVHHGDQLAARRTGYVISSHHGGPVTVPLRFWNGEQVILHCDNTFEFQPFVQSTEPESESTP